MWSDYLTFHRNASYIKYWERDGEEIEEGEEREEGGEVIQKRTQKLTELRQMC